MTIVVLLKTRVDLMKEIVIMTMNVNLDSHVVKAIVQLSLDMTNQLTVVENQLMEMKIFVLLKTFVDLMKEIVIMTMNVNLDSHVEQTIVLQILA